jgi:hypothetical protein
MTHPDSESLAWERVHALEQELDRLRRVAGNSIDVLRVWSQTMQRETTMDGLRVELLAEKRGKRGVIDVADAMTVLRRGLRGLAFALDDAAERLESSLGRT